MEIIKKRCAIYTRKSHEEGLEQEFNSLDAQRMAGESYVASQAHEGWECLPTQYNDGGYSGGTLARPALQHLLTDIKAGKIDCIVVYKIDRLTRSLLDFARIIELLDEHSCSFVAVTQSFNTSDSMGRLMLNVLLSFAQYEREITSERIRDKFAASCKLGMWMGGNPPLGYDPIDRKLIINENEATIIRTIYHRFLEIESVTEVARELNAMGYTTKSWTSTSGKFRQGGPFSKKAVRKILNNPIYKGKIVHKDKIYDGEHKPIIDEYTWDRAQNIFKRRKTDIIQPTSRISQPPLLKELIFCGCCASVMIPTYTRKKGKQYRYYLCFSKQKGINEDCTVGSISAYEIEAIVTDKILHLLSRPEIASRVMAHKPDDISSTEILMKMQEIPRLWDELFPAEQIRITQMLIKQVIITENGLDIKIHSEGLNTLKNELKEAA